LSFVNRKLRFLDSMETDSMETPESPLESEEHHGDRWRGLDELLGNSFALISPAYLFMCFPPKR
jgi:hypothetical protein